MAPLALMDIRSRLKIPQADRNEYRRVQFRHHKGGLLRTSSRLSLTTAESIDCRSVECAF
jgi:hypothetical protein